VLALHPGVSIEEVRDNTGFDLLVSRKLAVSGAPREQELSVLRNLDPDKLYIA
jgi:glutaconate CoA-transferase, subunit B